MKNWLAQTSASARADFWAVYDAQFDSLQASTMTRAKEHPEFGPLARRSLRDAAGGASERDRWKHAIGAAARGDWAAYDLVLRERGALYARAGVSFRGWYDVVRAFTNDLTPALVDAYGDDKPRLTRALMATQEFGDRVMATLIDAYLLSKDDIAHYAEARNQALLSAALDPIVVLDPQGIILDLNPAATSVFGYGRGDALGLSFGMLLAQSADRDAYLAALREYPGAGATAVMGARREVTARHQDGSTLPVEIGLVPTTAPDSSQTFTAFLRDISSRRRIEHMKQLSVELEAQNAQIREASRLKSEFLANMSHELRTPLNSIIGFAELLHSGDVEAASPEHDEFLGDILTSGRHLLQLINDILDLSKVEAGKMTFHPEKVALPALVGEVTGLLRQGAAARGVQVWVDIAPGLEELHLDGGRLRQVLYNYLSNALKFTAEDGSVAIRAFPADPQRFTIEVADNGIGIEPAELSRLFVEFQQLDAGSSKRHAGTGLGLALVKRIVEAQGGTVSVRSTPGQGSVFGVTLPRSGRGESRRPPRIHEAAARSALRILVVEDNGTDQGVIVDALVAAGYAVEAVGTGAQAIERAQQVRFDAVTLDLVLPDASGLQVLASIREGGASADARVIILSRATNAHEAMAYRVDEVLPKPIDQLRLLAALQRAGVGPEDPGDRPILVVDDDAASAKLVQIALSQLGYGVVTATSGEAGLVLTAQRTPRAVVLDLLMPGMDGFEFLRRFRAQAGHAAIPVMIWTVKDLSSAEHQELMSSAQAVLAKGGRSETSSLLAELRSVLPSRQEGRADDVG